MTPLHSGVAGGALYGWLYAQVRHPKKEGDR